MKYVIILIILSLSLSAHSYEKAEELMWACNADTSKGVEELVQKIHCTGYVIGILDGMQLVFGVRPESTLFCPPKSGMSSDQQIRIVIKYLEDNPKELHTSARMSVLLAYDKAFPCK